MMRLLRLQCTVQSHHLERLSAVCIRALVDAVNEVHIDHRLYVRARKGQNVAQALVPGMELAQAARVLVQALRQRKQQPPCAVPALAQGHQPIRQTFH